MPGIKENIQVQTQGTILAAEQAGFSFARSFKSMPKWRRVLALSILIALVPGYLLARVGTEQLLRLQSAREALVAHPAFSAAVKPAVGSVTIVKNPTGTYSAYGIVSNQNLDLAAENVTYEMAFQTSAGQEVSRTSGTTYLLPNEKRYIVVPRIEYTGQIISGTLTLGDVVWQKKLSIPEVNLKPSEPLTYEELNPLAFIAEGAVVNNSPYELGTVRLVFLLFDQNNKIVGISQRDESKLVAGARRAYKQQWPGLYAADVSKVQVIATTNTLDANNITTETSQPTGPDDRETPIPF